jgi:hypothetical protein
MLFCPSVTHVCSHWHCCSVPKSLMWLRDRTSGSMTTDMSDWGTEQQGQWLQTWVTEGQNNRVNDYRHEWLRDRTTGPMITDMSDWGREQQGQWLQTWVTEGQNNRVNDYRHEWLRDRTTGSITTDMSDWGLTHVCSHWTCCCVHQSLMSIVIDPVVLSLSHSCL